MEEERQFVETRVGMCRSLDRWEEKLRNWPDDKKLNIDRVAYVTAISVRKMLNFKAEDYKIRWLTMDVIVANGKLFKTNNKVMMDPYALHNYVSKGQGANCSEDVCIKGKYSDAISKQGCQTLDVPGHQPKRQGKLYKSNEQLQPKTE